MPPNRTFTKHVATIPSGAAVSNAIVVGTEAIVAITTPAAWTAAGLFFEASFDGGTTWLPVVDDAATELTIATALIATASRCIVEGAVLQKLRGLARLRLASGPAAGRTNQAADRVFTVLSKTL